MTDSFSIWMRAAIRSHLELNWTSNDDHRLTLAVDVPSTEVPLGRRRTLAHAQRWEREFSQVPVDLLDLILIPPLTQQPVRRSVDAGIRIIAVEVEQFCRPGIFLRGRDPTFPYFTQAKNQSAANGNIALLVQFGNQ